MFPIKIPNLVRFSWKIIFLYKILSYFGLPNIWLRALLMKVNPEKHFYALKTGKPIFNDPKPLCILIL
jgi:hypothetical protein